MKRFFRENGLLLVLIAVLLAAVLAVGSAILGANPLTNFMGIVSTPFRTISSTV